MIKPMESGSAEMKLRYKEIQDLSGAIDEDYEYDDVDDYVYHDDDYREERLIAQGRHPDRKYMTGNSNLFSMTYQEKAFEDASMTFGEKHSERRQEEILDSLEEASDRGVNMQNLIKVMAEKDKELNIRLATAGQDPTDFRSKMWKAVEMMQEEKKERGRSYKAWKIANGGHRDINILETSEMDKTLNDDYDDESSLETDDVMKDKFGGKEKPKTAVSEEERGQGDKNLKSEVNKELYAAKKTKVESSIDDDDADPTADGDIARMLREMSALTRDQFDKLKRPITDELEKSLEEMLEEAEDEVNVKLDALDKHFTFDKLSATVHDLMDKLDKEIKDVNEKIVKVNRKAAESLKEFRSEPSSRAPPPSAAAAVDGTKAAAAATGGSGENSQLLPGRRRRTTKSHAPPTNKIVDGPGKNDAAKLLDALEKSLKLLAEGLAAPPDARQANQDTNKRIEDIGREKEDQEPAASSARGSDASAAASAASAAASAAEDDSDLVKVKVTNVNPSAATFDADGGGGNSNVAQKLQNALQDKLSRAGLDTGGRRIEVKVITTPWSAVGGAGGRLPALLGGDENDNAADMDPEEAQQFQHMVYNLMIGNQEAYNDIDQQRLSERSYKFSLDGDEYDGDVGAELGRGTGAAAAASQLDQSEEAASDDA